MIAHRVLWLHPRQATIIPTTDPWIDVRWLPAEVEYFEDSENAAAQPQTKGASDVTWYHKDTQ